MEEKKKRQGPALVLSHGPFIVVCPTYNNESESDSSSYNNEKGGNLYFLEQEGGTHNGDYAMEYFYNGLCWIWQ